MPKYHLLFIALLSSSFSSLHAVEAQKPSFDFIRQIDLSLLGHYLIPNQSESPSAQAIRLRTRNIDPSVNAFVGLLFQAYRFDRAYTLDIDIPPPKSHFTSGAGLTIGIIRRKQVLELDVFATLSHDTFAPGIAFVGEHPITNKLFLVHRSEASFFYGDNYGNFEPAFLWKESHWGVQSGYRLFTSKKARFSGPFLSLHLYFESPKIPFLFPSLG